MLTGLQNFRRPECLPQHQHLPACVPAFALTGQHWSYTLTFHRKAKSAARQMDQFSSPCRQQLPITCTNRGICSGLYHLICKLKTIWNLLKKHKPIIKQSLQASTGCWLPEDLTHHEPPVRFNMSSTSSSDRHEPGSIRNFQATLFCRLVATQARVLQQLRLPQGHCSGRTARKSSRSRRSRLISPSNKWSAAANGLQVSLLFQCSPFVLL